ncbi:MAG: HAD-IA family hydrolase, partial [Oscillospiraceae bacterium]
RLGVVSSKHTGMLVEIMEQHHLTDKMDAVLGGDVVTHGKPDPEGILIALERTGMEKCQVLFCGDTVIDAATAQNAGVDFCAVLNGTTGAPAFAEYPHVHIAPNLPELQQWLGL